MGSIPYAVVTLQTLADYVQILKSSAVRHQPYVCGLPAVFEHN